MPQGTLRPKARFASPPLRELASCEAFMCVHAASAAAAAYDTLLRLPYLKYPPYPAYTDKLEELFFNTNPLPSSTFSFLDVCGGLSSL